jgi:hypothetical protein
MSNTICDICRVNFKQKSIYDRHMNGLSLCIKDINCKELYKKYKELNIRCEEYKKHIIDQDILIKKQQNEILEKNVYIKMSIKTINNAYILDNNNSEKNEFIKKCHGKYDELYDYTIMKYENNYKEISLICRDHGTFNILPFEHLEDNYGCPQCYKCSNCGYHKKMGVDKCEYCNIIDSKLLYEKTKEKNVYNYLVEHIDTNIIYNKSVGTKYTDTHLYPDFRIECDKYQIIIEVDEFKHKNYNCEEKRMYDIMGKIGQPCVFIRYNPDSKDSDLETLLDMINKYINIEDITKTFKDSKPLIEYLFY